MKRFEDSGTMNRKEGFERPRSVTTQENTDLIEEHTDFFTRRSSAHTHTSHPVKLPNKLESVGRQLEK